MAWVKVIAQNRKTIYKLVREGFRPGAWKGSPARLPAMPVLPVEVVEANIQVAEG